MRDIEHIIHNYADAVERSLAGDRQATPRRRRWLAVPIAAAVVLAVVAVALLVGLGRDNGASRVTISSNPSGNVAADMLSHGCMAQFRGQAKSSPDDLTRKGLIGTFDFGTKMPVTFPAETYCRAINAAQAPFDVQIRAGLSAQVLLVNGRFVVEYHNWVGTPDGSCCVTRPEVVPPDEAARRLAYASRTGPRP